MAKTLYDKLWQAHRITTLEDGTDLLYVDCHLIHEVTSPQAFSGLQAQGRTVHRPDKTFATMDHNVSTQSRSYRDASTDSQLQLKELKKNCQQYGIQLFDLNDHRQGIVHVIGPELGLTRPGNITVCGDSHTSTHGAFASLAFGIGTSEVEHVLATQTIQQKKALNLRINIEGERNKNVSAKDVILYIISQVGTDFGTGYAVEFSGSTLSSMSMEERMTLCNMSIELGAKTGLIAADETTFSYLKGREYSPKGIEWQHALQSWKQLKSDDNVQFDKEITFNAEHIFPQISWGTSPQQTGSIQQPFPADCGESVRNYMGYHQQTDWNQLQLDTVFIGSCTNSRIEDLRAAAKIVGKNQVKKGVRGLVVPGSRQVKIQAEKEGLDRIFIQAGFEWREPGCSMCLAMNDDKLAPGARCASTSNRNFEDRQGREGRTHLVSPQMAAAAAIHGHFIDVSQLD